MGPCVEDYEWGGADARFLDDLNDAAMVLAGQVERARVDQLLSLVEVESHGSFGRDGALNLVGWLTRRVGMSRGDARWAARLVRLLIRVPDLAAALGSGAVSISHVEALARVAKGARLPILDEFTDQLLAHAVNLGVDDFETICQRFAELADDQLDAKPSAEAGWLSLAPTLFGEADIAGHLTADQAATVAAALDQLNRPDPEHAPVRRTLKQRNADALTDLAHHFLNQPPAKDANPDQKATVARRAKPTAVITLDLDTYLDQTRVLTLRGGGEQLDLAAIRCELEKAGPIPRDLADLFLCDADVQRLVLDPKGQPLNLGKPTPAITTGQRRVLHHRDRGCVFPTCDRPAHWCDAHHLTPRSQGGPTDIDNLVLLCRRHHRLIHGPHWNLHRSQDGVVTATRADGTTYQRDTTGLVDTSRG